MLSIMSRVLQPHEKGQHFSKFLRFRKSKFLLPEQSPLHKGKPTLVLDLDQTLVDSGFEDLGGHDFAFEVSVNDSIAKIYMSKRPGLDHFLQSVAEYYELVVFTAAERYYAEAAIDKIDPLGFISYRLFKDSCTNGAVKDLSKLGRSMKRVIIVDDSPFSFVLNPKNGLQISRFFSDNRDVDEELLHLTQFLKAAALSNDLTSKACYYKNLLRPADLYLIAVSNCASEEVNVFSGMTRLCHGYKEGTLPQSQVLSNDFRDYHLLSDERKILQMENKFLQTKLGIHLEFWQIDQRHLEEELLRANRICEKMEVSHAYDLAKLNCNLVWKDEEALILRLKLEKALDDLDDLQSRLNVLTTYYAIQKENSKHNAGNEEEMTAKKQIEDLEKQIEDLQRKIVDTESDYKAHLEKERHEKSVIESQSKKEMSGLMRERDFVWNQLKLMENDYCSRIKLKEEQIQTARAEVENLRTALQKTKDEKDAEVVKLSSDLKQVEDMLGHVMAKSNHEKDGHSTMEHELDENACHMHSPGSVSNSDVELPEGEPEVSVENVKVDHLTKGKKKVNREDRSPDAASKLSAALKRNDDLQLENQNLKVLYAELEANYNKQRTEKVVRNSKKGSITRNLKAELEAAAASDEKENLEDNSIRKRLRSAKGGTGRKGRLAEQDEHAITARKSNSKHKMSSEKLDASEQEKLSAEHSRLVKTGFFSNAFSIPKIKGPSTSVNTFR